MTTGKWALAHNASAGTISRNYRIGSYVARIGADAFTLEAGRAASVLANQGQNDKVRNAEIKAAAEAASLDLESITGKGFARVIIAAAKIVVADKAAGRVADKKKSDEQTEQTQNDLGLGAPGSGRTMSDLERTEQARR
jgi:hypothetical protein